MPGVSKDEIAAARKVNTFEYIKTVNAEDLIRVGNGEYKLKSHGSLCLREDGVWSWKSHDGVSGITAIDYLMRVCGLDFVTAVQTVNDRIGVPVIPSQNRKYVKSAGKYLHLPIKDSNTDTVETYLTGRGIDAEIIKNCLKDGLLYQSCRGRYTNCIFVCKDEEGKARQAIRRGCTGKYRGNISGSDKSYGFVFSGDSPDVKTLMLFEAPIDALSAATIVKHKNKIQWDSVCYLAMGGLTDKPVERFLAQHTDIETMFICTDRDEAGQTFARKMVEKYDGFSFSVKVTPSPVGKDYNDYLMYLLKEKQKDER